MNTKSGYTWNKCKTDLDQLRLDIRIAAKSKHSRLMEVLREELTPLGRWKLLPRGNPKGLKKFGEKS